MFRIAFSLRTADSFPVVASLFEKKRRPEIRLLFAGYIAFKTRYSCLQAFKFALWRLFIDFCFFWSKKVRETQKFTQITKWLGELRRKDVTIIPSLLFHLRGFVAQRKWNFPFWINGKEKSLWRIFLQSFFSLQSYCTRNLRREWRIKPRAARNEGVSQSRSF